MKPRLRRVPMRDAFTEITGGSAVSERKRKALAANETVSSVNLRGQRRKLTATEYSAEAAAIFARIQRTPHLVWVLT
jgi:hypothetical protein